MDTRRLILFSVLALIVFTLWTDWQKEYPTVKSPVLIKNDNHQSTLPVSLTSASTAVSKDQTLVGNNSINQTGSINFNSENLIRLKTDVLSLTIDPQYGDIVGADLLAYPATLSDKKQPFSLLNQSAESRYVANSRILVVTDNQVKPLNPHFTLPPQITETKQNWTVVLSGHTDDGLNIKKQFIIDKNSYLIKVSYDLINQSSQTWQGYFNTELLRQSPSEEKTSMFQVASYTGASYSNPEQTKYKKVSFKDISKKDLDIPVKGGWVAMQQHYFLSAWVPDQNMTNQFYTRNYSDTYTIGTVSNLFSLTPQQSKVFSSQLYLGPEVTDTLKGIAPGLDLTVDYGLLWILSSLLFSVMKVIYSAVGNWGWTIVLVTLLVKLVFYRLSASSYKSMANMRRLQPKLQALKDRFGDDKVKMSQATMELYRGEKVNPLGGCLPVLIQIPVFIALYWVLIESVELRHAPFIFWIHDLAAADPFHVLPVIMGITMLIQQKLNPAPPDPMQAKLMMMLPLFFTALFWGFPAGLVLYWIVNNVLSILQQWYITRKYGEASSTVVKSSKHKMVTIK